MSLVNFDCSFFGGPASTSFLSSEFPDSDMGEISGCAEIAVYEVALSEPQQSLTQMVKASFLGRGNNITLA